MKRLFALARAILPLSWYIGIRKAIRDRRTAAVAKKILAQRPLEVLSGPFGGMAFVSATSFGAYLPPLVGTYEMELHPLLQKIITAGYERILDVGAAEGYYAVGLARAMPRVRVLAYDIDPKARELCAQLAAKNGVADRVELRAEASATTLDSAAEDRCLLICDCEGYEDELIDPARFPRLAECDVLVEFHDFIRPGVGQRITARLAPTHTAEIIDAVARPAEPVLAAAPFLSRRDAIFAGDEFRPPGMQWGWFASKSARVQQP